MDNDDDASTDLCGDVAVAVAAAVAVGVAVAVAVVEDVPNNTLVTSADTSVGWGGQGRSETGSGLGQG